MSLSSRDGQNSHAVQKYRVVDFLQMMAIDYEILKKQLRDNKNSFTKDKSYNVQIQKGEQLQQINYFLINDVVFRHDDFYEIVEDINHNVTFNELSTKDISSVVSIKKVVGTIRYNQAEDKLTINKENYYALTIDEIDPFQIQDNLVKIELLSYVLKQLASVQTPFVLAKGINRVKLLNGVLELPAVAYVALARSLLCYPNQRSDGGKSDVVLGCHAAVIDGDVDVKKEEVYFSRLTITPTVDYKLEFDQQQTAIRLFPKSMIDATKINAIVEMNHALEHHIALVENDATYWLILKEYEGNELSTLIPGDGVVVNTMIDKWLGLAEKILLSVYQLHQKRVTHSDLTKNKFVCVDTGEVVIQGLVDKTDNHNDYVRDIRCLGTILSEIFQLDEGCAKSAIYLTKVQQDELANIIIKLENATDRNVLQDAIITLRKMVFEYLLSFKSKDMHPFLRIANVRSQEIYWKLFNSRRFDAGSDAQTLKTYKQLLLDTIEQINNSCRKINKNYTTSFVEIESEVVNEIADSLEIESFYNLGYLRGVSTFIDDVFFNYEVVINHLTTQLSSVKQIFLLLSANDLRVADNLLLSKMLASLAGLKMEVEACLRDGLSSVFDIDDMVAFLRKMEKKLSSDYSDDDELSANIKITSIDTRIKDINEFLSQINAAKNKVIAIDPTEMTNEHRLLLDRLLRDWSSRVTSIFPKNTVFVFKKFDDSYAAISLTHTIIRQVGDNFCVDMVVKADINANDILQPLLGPLDFTKDICAHEVMGALIYPKTGNVRFEQQVKTIFIIKDVINPINLTPVHHALLAKILAKDPQSEDYKYLPAQALARENNLKDESIVFFNLAFALVYSKHRREARHFVPYCYEIVDSTSLGSGAFAFAVNPSKGRLCPQADSSLRWVPSKRVLKFYRYRKGKMTLKNNEHHYFGISIQNQFERASKLPYLKVKEPLLLPKNHLCIWIESHIDGDSLDSIIEESQQGCVDVDTRLIIARALTLNLIQLHDRRVIHGDVKPDNARYNKKLRQASFIDVNMSEDEGTVSVLQGGAPIYCPPEKMIAQVTLHPTHDVYSLGIMLKELFYVEPWNQEEVFNTIGYLRSAFPAFIKAIEVENYEYAKILKDIADNIISKDQYLNADANINLSHFLKKCFEDVWTLAHTDDQQLFKKELESRLDTFIRLYPLFGSFIGEIIKILNNLNSSPLETVISQLGALKMGRSPSCAQLLNNVIDLLRVTAKQYKEKKYKAAHTVFLDNLLGESGHSGGYFRGVKVAAFSNTPGKMNHPLGLKEVDASRLLLLLDDLTKSLPEGELVNGDEPAVVRASAFDALKVFDELLFSRRMQKLSDSPKVKNTVERAHYKAKFVSDKLFELRCHPIDVLPKSSFDNNSINSLYALISTLETVGDSSEELNEVIEVLDINFLRDDTIKTVLDVVKKLEGYLDRYVDQRAAVCKYEILVCNEQAKYHHADAKEKVETLMSEIKIAKKRGSENKYYFNFDNLATYVVKQEQAIAEIADTYKKFAMRSPQRSPSLLSRCTITAIATGGEKSPRRAVEAEAKSKWARQEGASSTSEVDHQLVARAH